MPQTNYLSMVLFHYTINRGTYVSAIVIVLSCHVALLVSVEKLSQRHVAVLDQQRGVHLANAVYAKFNRTR